jgi:hypothetical protein
MLNEYFSGRTRDHNLVWLDARVNRLLLGANISSLNFGQHDLPANSVIALGSRIVNELMLVIE